jgi:cell division protein FtsL
MAPGAATLKARTSPAHGRRPRRAPLRVVQEFSRPGRKRRNRTQLLGLAALALVLGSLLSVVAARAYLTQGQVRLARLQTQLDKQLGMHRDLELQVANLEKPANVLAQAQRQGLVVPNKVSDLPQVSLSSPNSPTTASTTASRGTGSSPIAGIQQGQSVPGSSTTESSTSGSSTTGLSTTGLSTTGTASSGSGTTSGGR